MRRFICLLFLAAIAATPAGAHNQVEKTAPAADEVLKEAPRTVQIWFEGNVHPKKSTIEVKGGDGADVVVAGSLENLEEGTSIRVTLKDGLPKGPYGVVWTALSGDGHRIQGAFRFTLE